MRLRPLARRLAPVVALVAACRPTRGPAPDGDGGARERQRIAAEAQRTRTVAGPLTRAERSRYLETSSGADVAAFLDSLRAASPAAVELGEIGRTSEGRSIPYAVVSRPLARTPEAARALRRPVVYVQGNIHGGEVEGKEALLALLRDLLADPRPNALDSVVLVAVPNYNADGNDALAAQAVNRGAQNGPERVGRRPNGRGLDLNRDYVKAEAPETRASLAMLARWDPDVFVDLHTTNGSYHGYALTYSPSLSPAAPWGAFTRDTLLPALRRRVRERHNFETFDYGNFDLRDEDRDLTDTVKQGWYTYDHRPRYGTNYVGVRGRVSVLSEAYSHDPFERRVRATYAFVRELLSLVAERGVRFCQAGEAAGGGCRPPAAAAASLPVRSELTREPYTGPVIFEQLVRTGDSARTQPGVPPGLRRTGRFVTQPMKVYDRFTPTLTRPLPAAYLVRAADTAALALLRLHGVRVSQLAAPFEAEVRAFTVDSIARAARAFQGHAEVRLTGRWATRRQRVEAGSYAVSTAQPLGRVAAYLLEPESDDGLVTWNVFDPSLRVGGEFPVLGALSAPPTR